MNLAEAIKEAAQRGEQMYLKVCTVDSVDCQERTITCTPIDGGAQLEGVQLQALTSNSEGLLIVPQVGSVVIIGYLDKNNAGVLQYGVIDKILLNVSDSIIINGGENKGLVKVKELTNKINALEQRCNDIVTALQGVSIVLAPSGTFPLAPYFTMPPLQTTQQISIENEKVQH
jgi:hypothetical protein